MRKDFFSGAQNQWLQLVIQKKKGLIKAFFKRVYQ